LLFFLKCFNYEKCDYLYSVILTVFLYKRQCRGNVGHSFREDGKVHLWHEMSSFLAVICSIFILDPFGFFLRNGIFLKSEGHFLVYLLSEDYMNLNILL
jgi:uncharacterized membrane protein YqaE (UPF0057 family)